MFREILRLCKKESNGLNLRHFYHTDDVRVRFAPSPTGFLHLGGLRTALYNYLYAKAHNGRFILRIEDTDQTRLVEGAADQLQSDLEWAGIDIHEGPKAGGLFGPYIQSKRLHIYSEHVKNLLENKSAYYCFCSDRRLELLKKEAIKARQVPKYDNRCRHLSPERIKEFLDKGQKPCIRFKLSSGVHQYNDLIYGNIAYDVTLSEGDPVIIKSDGYPTYHFANVVDDHLMKITHVLRGVEWQISTTKHILLYRAFNWVPPQFGHLPLLMNADGTKLSKRQGDIRISYYKENNIQPLALINFIVHSGGGFAKDLEQNVSPKCYTIDELAKQFDISTINAHSGRLMSERLLEFNKLELKRKLLVEADMKLLVQDVQKLVVENFKTSARGSLKLDATYVEFILKWAVNRIDKISDLVSQKFAFLWVLPTDYNLKADQVVVIDELVEVINEAVDFQKGELTTILKKFAFEKGIKYSQLMRTLRSVLSGLQEGPGVAEMMEILGKENTITRLELCLSNKTHLSDKYI